MDKPGAKDHVVPAHPSLGSEERGESALPSPILFAGERLATSSIFPKVYAQLRQLAARHLSQENRGHALQPTELVNEAYLRMSKSGAAQGWDSRSHFFGSAARVIRQILTDHARNRRRQKRGGGQPALAVDSLQVASEGIEPVDLLALDESLKRLEAFDPTIAMVVELRYFAGLNGVETARILGLSESCVTRHWQFARAWLHRDMHQDESQP